MVNVGVGPQHRASRRLRDRATPQSRTGPDPFPGTFPLLTASDLVSITRPGERTCAARSARRAAELQERTPTEGRDDTSEDRTDTCGRGRHGGPVGRMRHRIRRRAGTGAGGGRRRGGRCEHPRHRRLPHHPAGAVHHDRRRLPWQLDRGAADGGVRGQPHRDRPAAHRSHGDVDVRHQGQQVPEHPAPGPDPRRPRSTTACSPASPRPARPRAARATSR